jgi:predicted nucleic acid-binding protein
LEYFNGGAAAEFFAPAIQDSESLLVPTVVLYEVFKRVLQLRGRRLARTSTAMMERGKSVDLTTSIAVKAARISVAHKLSMADSMIYTTAVAHNATLWTQDAEFSALPNVRYRSAKR